MAKGTKEIEISFKSYGVKIEDEEEAEITTTIILEFERDEKKIVKQIKSDVCLEFKQARETAANLEKDGFYEKAAQEWILAAKQAVNFQDWFWCTSKAAFCQNSSLLKKE